MSKKLWLVLILPLAAFLLLSVFSLGAKKQSSGDFNSFISAYEKMISDDTLLDDYAEKSLSYDDILIIDGQQVVETNAFCLAVGENFELKQESKNSSQALSIELPKKCYVLESECGDKYEIENAFCDDGGTYLPIKSVAKSLGYELTFNDEEIVIQKTFETKRLIVTASGSVENFGAIEVAENYSNLHIFEYATEKQAMEAYNKLKSLKNIENVEVDLVAKIEGEDAQICGLGDSFSYTTWGAKAMNVDVYSNFLLTVQQTQALSTVYVAVLDTGIDTDHPWFKNRAALNLGVNYSTSSSSTSYSFEDGHHHGTHVSGTIVDLTLSNVKIIPVKVMGNNGYGYVSGIVNGMQYVLNLKEQGYNVVAMNMSLGVSAKTTDSEYSSIASKVNTAYSQGIVTVAAAGNDGVDASTTCPANVPNAITVSAVGVSGNTYSRPSWSNYGSVVDVAAPGNEIVSAGIGGGTISLSGTSMAAPHITACVALLKSNPERTYTPSEIDLALKSNVIDLGDEGKDIYFGYGMVDMEYANTTLLDSVEFSRNGGACYEVFYLTLLHSNPKAKIYYTTDGSIPSNTNGTLYTSVIRIETSTRIRAIAYLIEGGVVTSFSKVSEMTYHFSNIDVPENYEVTNGVLTGYTGMLKHIIIPAEVNGESITEIGEYAFRDGEIESITLSNNVTKIGKAAFYNCVNLENVYAPKVEMVGDGAFYNCTKLTKLDKTNFGELKRIGKQSFYNCISLSEITLPKLDFVDYQAFCMYEANKSQLESINFPQATIIAEEAFVYCRKLSEIILPNVETICSDAFYECSIGSVSLPEAKYLGNYAFYMNSTLTQVSIPKAEIISSFCFYGTSLTKIEMDNVTFVGKKAFYNCVNLSSVKLKSLKEVGEYAFSGCSNLSVFEAENILTIQNHAFYGCESLSSINFSKVVSIQNYAFTGCGLQSVTLSESLSFVGTYAFYGTQISCEFYIYSQTPIKEYLDNNKFAYIDLTNKSTLYLYKETADEVHIMGYTSVGEDLVVPSYLNGKKVTRILSGAFKNCQNLKALNSSFIQIVEADAFSGCSNLSYVNLENARYIGARAFKNCQALETLNIKNATVIYDEAFYGCPKLLFAEVSKDVSTIGDEAFAYLDQVDGVYQMVSTFVLYGYNSVARGYVEYVNILKAMGYVNSSISYKENYYVLTQDDFTFENLNSGNTASIKFVQNYLSKNIVVPSTVVTGNSVVLRVVSVGEEAFDDCSFIENIVLPSSVTKISNKAFKNCSRLKSINLENITQIGENAFEGCDSLKVANLPQLLEISVAAFKDCPSLDTIIAPNVTYVYKNAFMNCYSLKNVELPNAIYVLERAFYNCSSLETISLNNAIVLGTETNSIFYASVGEVFYGCLSLTHISLGAIIDICPNCFVGTNLKEVVLGSHVGWRYLSQTSQNFGRSVTIYGYSGSSAQTVANYSGATFVPLDAFTVSLDSSFEFAQYSTAKIYAQTTGMDATFEWYETPNTVANGTKIEGATNSYLEINANTLGTKKYFVKVTNFNGEEITSNVATVLVKASYSVTSMIESGEGVIHPYGAGYVMSGDSKEFLITPRIGYYVSNITVNGVSVDESIVASIKDGGIYTLENITTNVYLYVFFEIYKYNLSLSYGANGTASLSGLVAEWGTSKTISFNFASGYSVSKMLINGKQVYLPDSVATTLQYTLEDIQENKTIQVFFANKFNVETENLSEGGEITTSKIVDYNGNCTITITPQKGYKVVKVVVDGKELSSEEVEQINSTKTYTFQSVKTDHKISALYTQSKFKIIYEVGDNGTIYFDKQVEEIENGENRTIYITPDKGYILDSLVINGQKVKVSGGSYVIKNIGTDISIQVTFKVDDGSGSITWQAILAIVLGGSVLITVFIVLFKTLSREKAI